MNSKASIPPETGFASGQVCVANAKNQPEIDMLDARLNAKLPTRSIFHRSCAGQVSRYSGWRRGLIEYINPIISLQTPEMQEEWE